MIKRSVCSLLLCFWLGSGFNSLKAQNILFEKNNFPSKKDEFKDALKKLESGRELFKQGRKEFDDFRRFYLMEHKYYPVSFHDYEKVGNQAFSNATPLLLEAQKFNPSNAELNYMLGFIYLYNNPLAAETINFLETANSLGGLGDSDIEFWLARAYHLNAQWNKAIPLYESYSKNLSSKAKANAPAIEEVTKRISECRSGQNFSAKPERVFIDNLGPNINTSFPEYRPSISADEETIFYTSRRSGTVGNKKDQSDKVYYEDIFSSVNIGGKWQPSKRLSKNVNTEEHDAVAGLSPDGSRLFVFRSTPEDRGDLYQSTLFGLDWEQPVRMNKFINTKYHESTVSLSYDGKRIYFISNKTSGLGDRDIYYSDLDINGEWGPAKNLGPEINTKYGEESVYIHPDGVTLYFSSKGHSSMGGYDIFKTSFVNGKWTRPENLGYPINGPDDDVFFVVSGSANRAYFSSSKAGGYGDHDLYKITFLGPEKAPILNTLDQLISIKASPVNNLKAQESIEIKSAKLTILKGIISDDKNGKPIEAIIDLIDNEKNEILATFKSNSSTGKYLVNLPSGRNYGLAVRCEGFLFHSENFVIPETSEYQEFIIDIALKKLEVGNIVVLKNIFFDSDKSNLRAESNNELLRLVKLLKDNPTAKIEISSHTDGQGSDDYNLKLSQDRSKAVIDFLVSKGIVSGRLIAKGYGETQLIDNSQTTAGRQKNRRTEFKILAK